MKLFDNGNLILSDLCLVLFETKTTITLPEQPTTVFIMIFCFVFLLTININIWLMYIFSYGKSMVNENRDVENIFCKIGRVIKPENDVVPVVKEKKVEETVTEPDGTKRVTKTTYFSPVN